MLKPTAKGIYSRMLEKKFQLGKWFAEQGDDYKREVAEALSPGGVSTAYKKGDVASFDKNASREAVIAKAQAIDYMRGTGLYNTPEYAYDRGKVFLSDTGYLSDLIPKLGESLSQSQKTDAEMDRIRQQTAETSGRWLDLKNASNDTELDRWYNMLMADYLLGDRNELFDFEKIDARYSAMSDEEYDKEYKRLTDQWDNLDWEALTGSKANNYKSNTSDIQAALEVVQDEVNRRNEFEALRANIHSDPNFEALSVYDGHEHAEGSWAAKNPDAFDHYYDMLYFINNPVLPEGFKSKVSQDWIEHYQRFGYDLMTPEEVLEYTYLVEENRMDDAARYIDLLQPELNARKADADNAEKTVRAQHLGYGALDSAVTVLTNPLAAGFTAAGAVLGIDDPNHPIYSLQRGNTTTRSVYGQTLGELAPSAKLFDQNVITMGYNVLMSLGDMAMARGIGGGLSKATGGGTNFAKNAMQFIMSTESAANTYLEDLNRGWDHDQAIIHGLANGLIEAWTERGFMDSLFSEGGTFLSRVMKSGIAEGWEEIESGGLQLISDALIAKMGNDPSQVEEVYQAFAATMSESEAARHTFLYFANQLAADGLSGFASGSLMQAGTTAVQDAQYRGIGKNPLKNGDIEGILLFADNYTNKSDVADAVNKVRDKQAKGIKVTARDVGELVHSLINAIGEKNSKVLTDVLTDSVEGRLEELGEDPANTKSLAEFITDTYLGKKTNLAERIKAKWSDAASQVFKELNSTTTVSKEVVPGSIAGTEGQLEDGQYVAGDALAAEKNRVGHSWKTEVDEKIVAAQRDAFIETAKLNEALNTKISTATAVGKAHNKAKNLMKGKPKMATYEVMAEGSDGKEVKGTFERVERKNGKLLMVMKDADTEIKVDADKITNGGDEGILTIINYAQEGARHEMSTDEINTMVNTYLHEGGDVDSFVQQFQDNYLSGYSGVNAPAGTISGGIASIAYEQGKAEAVKDEADRVARAQKARKVETPTVGWLGDVTSDTSIKGLGDAGGLDEAVKNMTVTQRAMVEFGRHLAKAAKINVVFFASKAGADGKYTTQNGSYDPNTHTIYLDINSGASTEKGRQKLMKRGDLGAAIGRVAGHELTHVLEATSPEYYAKYKQAVKAALKAKNLDYASLVREKINAALANGNKLTYAGAEAEVIADASEYMLQDSKFVKNMDQGLKGKVKEIVQKFLNKVNEAFRMLKGGHDESAVLRNMTDGVYHYEKKLQELWDMAFDEMLGAEVRTDAPVAEATGETETVQKSIRERDDAYIAAVERGDMVTAQKMVDEAAEAAGYEPVKLYHGTRQFGFTKFDTDKSDDKMSIFVTDDRRIAESYSREGADIPVKNGIKQERYDFMQQSSAKLEPYVQKWVDKNLKVPTERELRAYTDGESATILSAVDWVDDYLQSNWDSLNTEAKSAISKAMFYAEKLAAIPSADMEDETDGYALRMKFEDAVQDLAWEDRNSYEEIAPVLSRPVYESANNLISARFNDPFYNVNDGTFVSKWDVTDKLGDKLFTGIYELYGDMENLLEIDANDSNWNTIDGETIGRDGVFVTTREVAEFAKKNGFNGVEIKNVRDGGGMTGYHAASNVLIFFDSTALKSADPVTYDDAGDVIPLSERFNTANEDIRYSHRDDGSAHPMQRQFSVRQLAESLGYELKMLEGTDAPYAIVDSNGREVTSFTADQIKNTPLGGLIDAAVAAGNIDDHAQQEQLKMIADLATLAAQYKDQAMVWEIAGSQLYSAIKNNSDKQYNKTVDFGTICSKTQAVVDVLSETMLKLDRGLTREEVITAYNKTAKNGLSVPCGPCYVFSRWMGVPGLLNSMANYQSRFGGMTAEEVTAYIDGVQARYSSDGERFSKVIGKQKTKLENRLESIASRMQKAMATGSDMTALFREADEVEREYADVEAYNWVTQVLCQSKRVKGTIEVLRDADGIVKLDPSYKPVPHSILFDMRRTGEFAKYPKSWKYRSTRGAGMGKSILPYSGAGLGDTVYGEQKRRTASQNAFLNPNMTKTQRIRAIKNATKRMKSQNLIGGHRFQSTSDYRPEWGLDYIMTFLEMQAVGAKGQLYTKVIEAVDMFATAGIEVNLSIMANGDGWHYDKNGNPVLGVEDFSSVSGIDFSEALKKTREYDNVQMILVGMNDTHIRLALADDRITFVIPWHSSGSSESILKQLFDAVGEELHTGSDYQEIQSDKPVSRPTEEQKRNMTLRTKIITGKFAKVLPTETEREAIEANEFLNDLYTRFYLNPSATDTYGVKLSSEQASQVFPYEYWDTNLTYENADENGRRFVRYCESIGLVPRFEKFKDDHGYWKLLIDRRMYNRDGSYHTPEVIDVTGVEIGDIASSVSQAKYGDPVKTGNAVMETIEELRTKAGSPSYPEPSITNTMEDYGDEVEVEPRPIQQSIRDLPEDTVTYRDYLTEADSSIAATIEERNALSIYQKLLKNHAEASEKVIEAEAALAAADEAHKPEARKALAAARVKQKDLYNRLLNVERQAHVQTLVKRSNQIIGDLYGKDQAELDKMLADKERRIASLKADITGLKGAARTQREADIREQEREVAALKSKATKALLANSERYQRQIDEIRLRRDLNIEIGKRTRHIKRIVKRLNDRIIHEEDYKNVKEPLKPVVHKLVQTFIDGFGNMVFDQKTADRLRSVYDEIANEDGAPEFYSDDVANWLSELSDMKEWDALIRAEGSSSLGAAEEKLTAYSRVAEIADHIYKLVTAADEIFIDGKREKFNAFSTETGTALIERKDSKLLVGKARDAYNAFQNLVVKGNLTPQFFFEHLKNSGMTRLFDGLMRGQTEYAQAIREGQEAISDAKKRYNFYSWQNMKTGVQFHTEQGHDIVLTVPVMMSIYAAAKREATNKLMGTHHLDQGGFRYDTNVIPRQKGKPWKAVPGSDLLHKLSKADIEKITNTLTAEQKACADELVSYLSNECAAQGNRTSMELYGIKKYNEEYYFPFKTDSDQRHQRSDAGAASTTNDARVKHTRFTHSLRKGANTPLVMGDFFDVIADHINLMATYSSFVVPIESMNRVMNTKINEEADGSGNDVTIRSLIGRKYGEASQKYIADLLKDLNGGPQTDNRGGLSALFRAFKRGAVMGSLSVTLQQPTAIVRAFAYVNPKYFAHITMEGNKKTWERMMKHSGTAVIKDMGKFDVGTGHMANDWIANSDIQEYNVLKRARFLMNTEGWKAVKDNTIEFLTSMPGVMDRITWTHIWKAVEAEQADQHPGMDRNSDEFLDMVGKRFDDVVNHTQVYDSVLAKSQNMRSKNPLTQMSTAFMSEPTLNANLYYSAVTGDHTAGQRAGIITSVIASNLLTAAMESLISAWNKDDDDRKFTEKYLAAFASRAVDNLNPMTMYPYLSDLWSMVSGYDIERTDLSVVKDLIDYTGKFFSNMMDEDKQNTWRDYENFLGTIANLFGIPAKNVSRDIRRIRNLVYTDKSASSPSSIRYTLYENAIPLGLWKDSNTAYYDRYLVALKEGDKQEQYDLKDYLTSTKGVKEDTVRNGVVNAYKKEYLRGGIAKNEAVDFLVKNDLVKGETADKKRQTAFKKVDEWSEGSEDYSVYNTIFDAVKKGNTSEITKGIKEMTANGYVESDVVSGVRGLIRESYMEGTMTQSQVKAAYKSHFAPKNFDVNDQNEWYWLFRELDWGKKNHNSTDGYSNYIFLKDNFSKYNETAIRNAWNELTTHGYEDKDVKTYVRTYILKPMVQEGKISTSRATELLKRWAPYNKDSDNLNKPKEWAK